MELPRPRTVRLGIWPGIFALIFAAFLYATFMRFTKGLGATTNLSDAFPWGIWIGFDILCGVGLAAGAFTLMATVHLFHIEKFKPIVRPTLLTGYLGYLLVCVGLMYDLGQPWRIWHALIYWNEHSVMFEVAWCVMLYTTVLTLEFSHIVFERLNWKWALNIMHALNTPLVILGVLLSTLHQSSLGTMYLIVPEKLHALWYTPALPLLFYISAIGAGLGMVILESHLSGRALGHELEMNLLEPLGRVMIVVLAIFGVLRLDLLWHAGALPLAFQPVYEGRMFLAEFVIGVLAPILLLSWPRVRRSPVGLVIGATCAVLGFMLYRLNVSITGIERASGTHYVPSWMEMTVSVGLMAIGVAVFGLAVRYLPIFPASKHGSHARGA
ncbi:MAG: Ni/Fe-hydrogenase cytochrome b subunit [Candidatus Eisenbacteria bacterium]|uniref:Ni/Fe-hydrogenase cytochrome b subunit n=1 Tax=Eiseniibacteriota bacterium TaxID=2212470 RepID=A0A933W0N1_UNCEI|nr:Ni/Fe-hydrogenase cytochrome b subunit [Candidatus Eisenbacteria bacterium]